MGTATAFLACYCPRAAFQLPGEPSDPGISSEFLPAQPGIQQGASRRSHVLVHVDPSDALIQHLHLRGHLLQRHPPPDGTRRAARQSPGQYRRLTHAHAAATGVTRQGAPAPDLCTASNGPSDTGDGERHASTTVHLPPRPPLTDHGKDPSRPRAAPADGAGTQLSHPTAAPRSGE